MDEPAAERRRERTLTLSMEARRQGLRSMSIGFGVLTLINIAAGVHEASHAIDIHSRANLPGATQADKTAAAHAWHDLEEAAMWQAGAEGGLVLVAGLGSYLLMLRKDAGYRSGLGS